MSLGIEQNKGLAAGRIDARGSSTVCLSAASPEATRAAISRFSHPLTSPCRYAAVRQ